MKKFLAMALSFSLCGIVGNLYSQQPDPNAVDVRPDIEAISESETVAGEPVFDFGSLKLKSAGYGKCTGVTLVPNPGYQVQIRSQRFKKSFWGSAAQPSKVLSDWIELDQGGLRVKYDRAGGTSDYYRLFCRVVDKKGNIRPVDCRDVITIQDVKTGHCYFGPGSTDAEFDPLNMSIKNK